MSRPVGTGFWICKKCGATHHDGLGEKGCLFCATPEDKIRANAAYGKGLRRVLIESPYAGDFRIDPDAPDFASDFPGGSAENIRYLRACLHDSLVKHGEAPFASHAIYTQTGVLDDREPDERRLGIEAGLAWGKLADATVVYVDRGVSPGMKLGIERARSEGRPVEFRILGGIATCDIAGNDGCTEEAIWCWPHHGRLCATHCGKVMRERAEFQIVPFTADNIARLCGVLGGALDKD